MKIIKRVIKGILTLLCWAISLILLYEALAGLKNSDPWGLSFMFLTLPIGIIGIIFLVASIDLTKELVKNSDNQRINKRNGNR